MIYLNIKTATLRSAQYIGSEPTQRGTWLNLLCYCCEQENSGLIKNCAAWKDRQWQQTAGVTLLEVQDTCPLWSWNGDDLAVEFYPTDKQAEVQAKRDAGRRGGKKSGVARRPAPTSEASGEAKPEAVGEAELQPELQAELERKGKERNRNRKGKEQTKPAADNSAANDKEWLSSLESSPAYKGISIEVELAKAQTWCATNNRKLSRRFFVNWLNRAERPIATNNNGHHRPAPTPPQPTESVWHLEKRIEAARHEVERIQANPDNKEYVPGTFERRLKPNHAATVKELKARITEMRQRMAGIVGDKL